MPHQKPQVLAASLTPLAADKSIANERFAGHVKALLKNGCDGVLLFGTTGEANSFTVSERQAALESLLESGIPASSLMVGTGCCALPDTLSLTRHALGLGVNRVLVLPPFYYKNASEDGLFETFVTLVEQLANPALRLYLYHFPKMAVVSFTPELIARLAEQFPKQLAGIKDSTGNREHTLMLKSRFPALEVFAGNEMFLLDYLRAGGAGCISATTNLTARLAASVRDHVGSPEAELRQQQLSAVRAVFESYPMIGALKGLLAAHTGDPEWDNLRPPLLSLDEDSVAALRHALSKLNFSL